jgi:aspartate/methionine/tyrosine aminotransferase
MKLKEFRIERYFAKYEFQTKYILCASDCESFTVDEILRLEDDSKSRLLNLRLGYIESQGSLELRTAISKLYDDIAPDEVLAFSGAEEGIFTFMNTILDPGDHIIVQFPAYQSLFEIAESIGSKVTKWSMTSDSNWNLDIEVLKEEITSKTKAIVLNFPHNPTGSLISIKKFLAVIEIAKEKGIYVFSDEVYRFLEYSKENKLPAACDLYEKAVTLGVMSKSFGLPGLRIGWIATKDRNLLEKLAAFKDYTTICNSSVSEFLASIALNNRQQLLDRNMDIIQTNLKLLDSFFRDNTQFQWIRPLGGPIAFPEVDSSINLDSFCTSLIKEKGVLLLPGTVFGYGNNHFRIGFGRKNMPEALSQLEEFLHNQKLG